MYPVNNGTGNGQFPAVSWTPVPTWMTVSYNANVNFHMYGMSPAPPQPPTGLFGTRAPNALQPFNGHRPCYPTYQPQPSAGGFGFPSNPQQTLPWNPNNQPGVFQVPANPAGEQNSGELVSARTPVLIIPHGGLQGNHVSNGNNALGYPGFGSEP